MQLHYRFRFDDNGLPMLYVFSTCKDFIRTLPTLQYDAQSPEDLDTEGEDHAADEARYFCMARPIRPMLPVPAPAGGLDALDIDKLPPREAVQRMEVREM